MKPSEHYKRARDQLSKIDIDEEEDKYLPDEEPSVEDDDE